MGMKYMVKKVRMNYKKGKPEGYQMKVLNMPVVKEDALLAYIANSACLPQSTVLACTMAIADAVRLFVTNGHRVEFKKFGKFHLKVENTCVDTLEACQVDTVKRILLCFTPSAEIKSLLKGMELVEDETLTQLAGQ